MEEDKVEETNVDEVEEGMTDEFEEEEGLFDLNLDLTEPFNDMIEKHGTVKSTKPRFDPFDPRNW